MKYLKSQVLFMMAIVITILLSITAFADGGIAPRWDYLVMISAGMEVNSYNSATISVDADSDGEDVDEMRITVNLQQFNGG